MPVVLPRRAHVIDLADGRTRSGSGCRSPAAAASGWPSAPAFGSRSTAAGSLLDDYYRLYLSSVDRWAAKQHEPRALAHLRAGRRDPLAKLKTIAAALGKSFVVTLAYVDERAGLRLDHPAGPNRALHPRRHGRRADRQDPRPDLAQWTVLQLACDQGCTAFHLGESGQSASLAQYKEKLGGRAVDYAEIRLERLPYTRSRSGPPFAVKKLLRFRDV